MSRLIEQLKRHEGFSSKPYRCTAGRLTIGYGRNLDANGITEEEADRMLSSDLADVVRVLSVRLPIYNDPTVSHVRLSVLDNMAFNLGVSGLLQFKKMIAAFEKRDYDTAAKEMLNSKWAKQVKGRAVELSEQMRTGKWRS